MYTVHCEKSLRIEAIDCINNESLDWLRCMCTSRLHKLYNFYIITFKRYFKCILGVQIWCYIVSAQLLGERQNGKHRTAKQCKWAKWIGNCIKIGKMSSFQMNPHSKPISFANLFPSDVWNTNNFFSHYIDRWIKSHWSRIEGTIS